MEKISVAWEIVGQIAVGVGALVALVQGYKYLRSQTSLAKLEEKVELHTQNLEKDLKHLERIDLRMDGFEKQLFAQSEKQEKEMEKINESLNILGSSMASVINHMIDGNGIKKMRDERDKLVGYFIKKD